MKIVLTSLCGSLSGEERRGAHAAYRRGVVCSSLVAGVGWLSGIGAW